MIIGTPNEATGLGDVLLLTAVCRHNLNCIVELQPNALRFATLFNGICNHVRISDTPPTLEINGNDTFIEKKLRVCGLGGKTALPYVKLTDDEKLEGIEFADEYSNPLLIVPNCSPKWKAVREMEIDKWNKIIDKLKHQYTLIQIGLTSQMTEFKNTIKVFDLPLRRQASYFYGIGQCLGVDTGDRHLMTAVGGHCIVLHPDDSKDYKASDWHYTPSDTLRYVNFKEYEKIYEYL